VPFYAGAGQQVNAVVGGAGPVTTSLSGRLHVEPEQLDGSIAVFREAWLRLAGEVSVAREAITARAPGKDVVSGNAADAFNRVTVENKNSALDVWERAVTELGSIIRQLEEAKRGLVEADVSNVSSFKVY